MVKRKDKLPAKYSEKFPRVSSIVEALYPFEGTDAEFRFHNWLMSKDIPVDEYMRVASSAGTAIHFGLEQYIQGTYLGSEYPLYVKMGVDFLKYYKVKPIATEEYICTTKYQGTIDLIGEIDGELWILDWKSWSVAQHILGIRKGVYKYKKPYAKLSKASVQLSLYAEAKGIKNIGVVELAYDGYHFHKLKRKTSEELSLIIDNYYKNIGQKNGKILYDKNENIELVIDEI